jgi:2-oxoglutarate ferredoxin oxidoreductase subunit alpha
MIYGSAATGIRCMTSSSSPGISLKQEGISYAAGADLPIFFANVARGGPGLGNITGAQGDFFQSVRGGGHGDYRTFVMAPDSVEEMGNFPPHCYEVAERYRIPAMVLADGVLGQMMEPLEFRFPEVDPKTRPEPDWALGECRGRQRRLVGSYDLTEGKLELMTLKRAQRYAEVEAKEVMFEARQCDDAQVVLVAYGIAARACGAAVKLARAEGIKVGLFRPITLWPFPKAQLRALAERVDSFLVVEMSLGQLVDDVRLATEFRAPVRLHGRPSGVTPTGEEILVKIKDAIKAGRGECVCRK